MSNGIMVEIQRDTFDYLANLINKEFDIKSSGNSFVLHDRDAFIDENFYNKAVSDFVNKLKVYSEEMFHLEHLKEVFDLPMVNMRLTDEEVEILDYAVDKSIHESRKVLLMNLVKDYVTNDVLKIPHGGFELNDKEILLFIERHQIQEYENIRGFAGEEQFKRIIEQSPLFDNFEDYENKKEKILGTGGSK